MGFLNNLWADFFARLGSESHAFSSTAVDCQASSLKSVKLTFDFLPRFAQSVAALAQELSDPSGALSERAAPGKAGKDSLAFTRHTLYHFPGHGEWRCSVCNLYAAAPASLAHLKSGSRRVCGSSAFQRRQA